MSVEKIITLRLPEASIDMMRLIIAQHVQDAEQELCVGLEREDSSMISCAEAILRVLDPIHRELVLLCVTDNVH